MAGFVWKKELAETKVRQYHGHKCQITATAFTPNYRVDLKVDGIEQASDNTGNASFREVVGGGGSIGEQILIWGQRILEQRLKECPICHQEKIVHKLADYDREYPEMKDYEELCKDCRIGCYNAMSKRERADRNKEDEAYRKRLETIKPKILGGFKTDLEAKKVLKSFTGNKDIKELEDGFVQAKGIVKANDGTYWPVFLSICAQDGGEFYGADFIGEYTDNGKPKCELIPQEFVVPYLGEGRTKESLYPFKYKSLARIPGDFHQNWPSFT